MARRKIRVEGDPILRKKSKTVENIDEKIDSLIDDMYETMIHENGVGISAVQVGILKRIIIVNPEPDNEEEDMSYVLINPEIIDSKGEDCDMEGCLSVPGKKGDVIRPSWIKVKYMDIDGNEDILEATDFHARVLCHEIDHTNGILYIDKLATEEEIEKFEKEESNE